VISPVVEILLWSLCLLLLLLPESCCVLVQISSFFFICDCLDWCILQCESGLILVREKSSDIFRSRGLEHLCEREIHKIVIIVVNSLYQNVLGIASLRLLGQSI